MIAMLPQAIIIWHHIDIIVCFCEAHPLAGWRRTNAVLLPDPCFHEALSRHLLAALESNGALRG
jgi:hypothetical protein